MSETLKPEKKKKKISLLDNFAMIPLGGFLLLTCRRTGRLFGAREGLVCVALSWAILSVLGILLADLMYGIVDPRVKLG